MMPFDEPCPGMQFLQSRRTMSTSATSARSFSGLGRRWLTVAAAALFMLTVVPEVTSEGRAPVCSKFDPFPDEEICLIDSGGNRFGTCKQCLVGPRWDSLRESIGTARISGKRNFAPTIVIGKDKSHQLQSTILRILLEELLAYDVIASRGNSWATRLDEVRSGGGCEAFNMEVWPGDEEDERQLILEEKAIASAATGGHVTEGLFVPEYAPLAAAHWEGLRDDLRSQGTNGGIVGALDNFLRDGEATRPEDLQRLGLEGPDYLCDPATLAWLGWEESQCEVGRWYPPNCGSDFPSQSCYEAFFPDVGMSRGWYEAVIKNLGLNFSAVYLSEDGMEKVIADMYQQKNDFMYYWYEPHPLHLAYPSRRVELPSCTADDITSRVSDPMKSGINCTIANRILSKWASPSVLEAEPDLKHVYDFWQLSNPDVAKLLSYEKTAGGQYGVEDAACAFLTDPQNTDWISWVTISAFCVGDEEDFTWDEASQTCLAPSQGMPSYVLYMVVAGAAVATVMIATIVYLVVRHRQMSNYVRIYEDADRRTSKAEVGFISPLDQAVRVLQDIAKTSRSKDMQSRAIGACRDLLEADDIRQPIKLLTSSHTNYTLSSSTTRLAKKDLQLMVDFVSEQKTSGAPPTPGFNPTATTGRRRRSSHANATLFDNVASALASEHGAVLKTIGSTFALDAFLVSEISLGRPLAFAALQALQKLDLVHDLYLSQGKLSAFLLRVEDGYRDVPYHNRIHAADVVARVAAILHTEDFMHGAVGDAAYTSKCLMLATVIAAVVHDYDHTGTDNQFHNQSHSELSWRYNQQAVLENHSACECLKLLRDPQLNFLSHIEQEAQDTIYAAIIKLVLNTDMSHHFSITGDFSSKIISPLSEQRGTGPSKQLSFSGLNDTQKLLVLTVALKIADIGHSFLPFDIHIKWVQALEEEFFGQGRLELEAGREPGMLKHPEKPGVMDAGNSVAFFNVLALPMLKLWSEVFPKSGAILYQAAKENRNRWKPSK